MRFNVGDIVSRNGRRESCTYLVVCVGYDDLKYPVYDILNLVVGKHECSYLPDYLFTKEA